jgi:23S rRNA pseudouridine2605 synthase
MLRRFYVQSCSGVFVFSHAQAFSCSIKGCLVSCRVTSDLQLPAERLQKVLARAGITSRRKAEVLIQQGRVEVNGNTAHLGMKVTSADKVRVDGAPVARQVTTISYAFFKPTGVITSVGDDRRRPTVMDYLPDVAGLHPVGRLDMDSAGLLIMTNDGDLTLRLSHPRFEHHKTYQVSCREGRVSNDAIRQLEQGVKLEDGLAKAQRARPSKEGCTLVLAEGRNRQVRRMLAALGYDVKALLRTHIDKLPLGSLREGEYRELHEADFIKLGYPKRRHKSR